MCHVFDPVDQALHRLIHSCFTPPNGNFFKTFIYCDFIASGRFILALQDHAVCIPASSSLEHPLTMMKANIGCA